jgi:cation-transporting ATPase E
MARGQRNVFQHKSARSTWDILRENVFTVFNVVLFLTLTALYAISLSAPEGVRRAVLGDGLFSGGTVLINIIVGVFQEIRAKRALDRLAALSVREARVRRAGNEVDIPASDIVLGDVVVIRPGDRVPVDGPLLSVAALELDESLLTGETDTVPKSAGDLLRSGSFCVAGGGFMRADGIGAESFANRLTATARGVREPRTPLQRRVNAVIEVLVFVMAVVAALQLVAGQNRQESFLENLRHVTVIITSFVPAGLVLAITVSLSVGAVRISRYDTLVQRINAVESMGNITVLCVDKTGTLTQNKLTLVEVVPLRGLSEADARLCLSLYTSSVSARNNTAGAIASGVGAPVSAPSVLGEIAFSSARKWGGVALADSGSAAEGLGVAAGEPVVIGLGAPDLLLDAGDGRNAPIFDRILDATGQGLRVVVAVAARGADIEAAMTRPGGAQPVALAIIRDEIRPDIIETMTAFANAGVRVKVISGDSPDTVQSIAGRAGLKNDTVVTERELGDMTSDQFDTSVSDAALFARITPDTKRRIIASLTRHGEYVAMVGDGVNDVPALKESRLAIAMNDGAQIARDVSELVLLKNNMSALPRAFTEGQDITQKILASAKLYLAKNVLTIVGILFVGFVSLPFPADPRQISWITSVTVGFPCLALAFGWIRPNFTRGFSRGVLGYSAGVGLIGAVVCAAAFIISAQSGDSPRVSRTVFALTNLHYAVHVMWDTLGVNAFSAASLRRRGREVAVGIGMLVVGLGLPFALLVPGMGQPGPDAAAFLNIFNVALLTPAQWALIVALPLAGALAMRQLLYGAYARRVFRTLQHD